MAIVVVVNQKLSLVASVGLDCASWLSHYSNMHTQDQESGDVAADEFSRDRRFRPSLRTAAQQVGRQIGHAEFMELLASSVPPPLVVPCMNPTCRTECSWPEARQGKPRIFCSRECQRSYSAVRTRLIEDLAVIAGRIKLPHTTYRERRELIAEARRRRWALLRYPEATKSGMSDDDQFIELVPRVVRVKVPDLCISPQFEIVNPEGESAVVELVEARVARSGAESGLVEHS